MKYYNYFGHIKNNFFMPNTFNNTFKKYYD